MSEICGVEICDLLPQGLPLLLDDELMFGFQTLCADAHIKRAADLMGGVCHLLLQKDTYFND